MEDKSGRTLSNRVKLSAPEVRLARRAGTRTRKILAMGTACAGLIFGTMLWRSDAQRSAMALFHETSAEKKALIERVVDMKSEAAATLARDYSSWDEMADFPGRPDPEFAQSNLDTCLATFGVDATWTFDDQARLVYEVYAEDVAATGDSALPAGRGTAANPQAETRALPFDLAAARARLDADTFAHFFVPADGSWLEVRGARLHRAVDRGRTGSYSGYFFVGRRWDSAMLAGLTSLFDAHGTLVAATDPLPTPNAVVGERASSIALPGLTASGPRLDFRSTRPSVAILLHETNIAVTLLCAGVLLGMFLLVAGHVRFVSFPIERLASALRTGNSAPLDAIMSDRTEIGDAACLVREAFAYQEALRIARDAAQQSERAKSLFLAKMSHEIRTPMNGVIGLSATLAETSLSKDQHSCVEALRGSAGTLLTILDEILDFSTIDAGRLRLEREPFDVRRMLETAVGPMAPHAASKGIDLAFIVDPALPARLAGDVARVGQIVSNLLINAIKFTEVGTVRVAARFLGVDRGEIVCEFAVRDTGIGIPQDRLAAIFESFTQGDDSTTRKAGGAGLGLTIANELATLMGGGIQVESRVAHGSVFSAKLRLGRVAADVAPAVIVVEKAAVPATVPANGPDEAEALRGIRVLMAEDNPVNRMVALRTLAKWNLVVDVAQHGAEAVAAWTKGGYALILMDCQMPELDGYGATAQIRERETATGAARTPIIALTANVMPGDRERCLDAGMDDYVAKPIRPEILLQAILRHVSKPVSV